MTLMTACPDCRRKLKRRLERRNRQVYKVLHCNSCGYERMTLEDAFAGEFVVFI